MKLARVFPRKTAASPTDDLTFFGPPPEPFPEIDEVHVSVTFTYDRERAEDLAEQWRVVGVPVKLGGPAYDDPCTDEFVQGRYLKPGYIFTSRGCNNRCWFCSAWRREGKLRELPIQDGWNVLDNNLLQCSDEHIRAVFEMMSRQDHYPVFTGGLEAKMLKPWHCELLRKSRTRRMYFAYDTPDDYEPLVEAGRMLLYAGFKPTWHYMCCYNLIGYKGDTFEKAQKRLEQTIAAGFMPYAMLYRDAKGEVDTEWRRFQREWCRPALVSHQFGEYWIGRKGSDDLGQDDAGTALHSHAGAPRDRDQHG